MAGLLIPKSEGDMTPSWIYQATSLKPVPETLKIITDIQAGQGILSSLYRVQFKTESGKEESILVKLLPKNPTHLALNLDQQCNQREIQFYSKVIPEIAKVSPSLGEQMCKYYNGKYEGSGEAFESLLIMEDLKQLGYSLLQTDSPNWVRNLEKATTFIAKLHAVGVYFEKKNNSSLPKIFPFIWKANDSINFFMEMAKNATNAFDESLAKHNCPEAIRQAYSKLNEKVDKVIESCFKMGDKHPVLIHGDFYKSNILVKESDPDAILKIIDWQFAGYADATYELSTFLLTSLPMEELNRGNVEKFVKLYWKEFTKSCEENGSGRVEREENEFLEFFNTWGIGLGYCWLILSLDAFSKDPARPSRIAEVMEKEFKFCEFMSKNI